jgi:7-cyano-7-deazaguanine reductase
MDETHLTQLGHLAAAPATPEEAVLERVPNPQADTLYLARFTAPEFTSLCPVTGQPDFAHLVIDYAPGDWLIESKSLKLYLGSFRNHGAFHEDCTVAIGRRIVAVADPRWLRIGGYWFPRGGIPIDVFWQTGPAPDGLWIPFNIEWPGDLDRMPRLLQSRVGVNPIGWPQGAPSRCRAARTAPRQFSSKANRNGCSGAVAFGFPRSLIQPIT